VDFARQVAGIIAASMNRNPGIKAASESRVGTGPVRRIPHPRLIPILFSQEVSFQVVIPAKARMGANLLSPVYGEEAARGEAGVGEERTETRWRLHTH